MKKIIFSCNIILMLLPSVYLIKENPAAFFAFNIYQAAQDGGAKAPLERIYASLPAAKGNKTTTTTLYEIAGGKSTVRIRAIEALFNATSDLKTSGTDPSTVIQLFKLDASKNKRTFSLTPDNRINSIEIPVSFQAIDNLNFKITVFTALGAGEYAFVDKTTTTGNGNVMVFAFGID